MGWAAGRGGLNGRFAQTLSAERYEAGYEPDDIDTAGVRRQAYQAVLSGGMGHVMGNYPVWYFGTGWQSALNTTGANTLRYLPALFATFDWWTLVPDTNGTVLTSNPSTGFGRAVAARTTDGGTVLAFTPGLQTLTIDMTKLTGPQVTARWYDSGTGTFATISGSPFPNTGSRSFTPPSNNGGGGRDFVLVLQSSP